MKRTKSSNPSVAYSKQDEPLVISKYTMDLLLKDDKPADVIGLYTFYYYTAKWQNSNRIKATTSYAGQALNMGRDKIIQVKARLIKLGLIENVVKRTINNKIAGHYIKINFVWFDTSHTTDFSTHRVLPPVANSDINALNTNNINALNTNKGFQETFPIDWLENKKFQKVMGEFIQHRKEKKVKLTPTASRNLALKLIKWGLPKAIRAVQFSLENGWTGVFEESSNTNRKTNSSGSHHHDDNGYHYNEPSQIRE